ncbi:uncharacterized protein LOC114830229 isoform X1 [Esox lucius]|uniref:Leucine-rich repeat-containing protein 72 n=1 Tax=Esox lucius TaxID=8010 RepID=A0A3P9A969_ESOLU|nr:uncharacterized protein LOC114830229 isoform X1 [Esox lucius]
METGGPPVAPGQLGQTGPVLGLRSLSFAYQGLLEIPYETILAQQDTLEVLDLSYNLLEEYPFIRSLVHKWLNYKDTIHILHISTNSFSHMCAMAQCTHIMTPTDTNSLPGHVSPPLACQRSPALLVELEKLSTLILDCNSYSSHVKFPYMPSVTTVCINKNKISNLPIFVEEIRTKFPNIKILSMMNNEAAPSYFNGGSLTQYIDYRQYVISQIPTLKILDDTEVLGKERAQAKKTYRMQRTREGSKRKKELHR